MGTPYFWCMQKELYLPPYLILTVIDQTLVYRENSNRESKQRWHTWEDTHRKLSGFEMQSKIPNSLNHSFELFFYILYANPSYKPAISYQLPCRKDIGGATPTQETNS